MFTADAEEGSNLGSSQDARELHAALTPDLDLETRLLKSETYEQ